MAFMKRRILLALVGLNVRIQIGYSPVAQHCLIVVEGKYLLAANAFCPQYTHELWAFSNADGINVNVNIHSYGLFG